MTQHIKLSLLALIVCTVLTNLLIAFPTVTSRLSPWHLSVADTPRVSTIG